MKIMKTCLSALAAFAVALPMMPYGITNPLDHIGSVSPFIII